MLFIIYLSFLFVYIFEEKNYDKFFTL